MSLRLPDELARELAAVARTEEVPISEAIRAALRRYIAACHTDSGFQKRARRRLEEDREVLERLVNDEEGSPEGP